jgi:phosphatidylserine/phosphatidylglycerophosphate/cardiolipin synthase-like enzyme
MNDIPFNNFQENLNPNQDYANMNYINAQNKIKIPEYTSQALHYNIEDNIIVENKMIFPCDQSMEIEECKKSHNYCLGNPNGSFAQEHQNCSAQQLLHGDSYFSLLFEKLMAAKRFIYICGWAISPEIFLLRPVSNSQGLNNRSRLMDVLKYKAEQGVLIKMLIYKEISITLPLNSIYTKKTLESLHKNIRVKRHPKNRFKIKPYSDHEKVVIIDEEVAFVGGIDLFWGRWDNGQHLLYEYPNLQDTYQWPGIDYSNDRVKDRNDVKNYEKDYIDRQTTPRMPWHDIAVFVEGACVVDLVRHFLQRWEFQRKHKSRLLTYSKNHFFIKFFNL